MLKKNQKFKNRTICKSLLKNDYQKVIQTYHIELKNN